MGFGPGAGDISRTLLALGDRLSGILVENKRMKAREAELATQAKAREQQFKLREQELALKFMEQGGAGAGGGDGAQPDTGPRLIDIIRADNAKKLVLEDFERSFTNEHGGLDWVDLNSVELKRQLNDLRGEIDNLETEKTDVNRTADVPRINARIAALQKRFESGRDLLVRMARARDEDPSLKERLDSISRLVGRPAGAALTPTAPAEQQAATPSAPTIPVDKAADAPTTPEVDGARTDIRDEAMLRVKRRDPDTKIIEALRGLIRGTTTEQANAALVQFVRDIAASEGVERAREVAKLFSRIKEN